MDKSDFQQIDDAVKRLMNGDESARKELVQLSYKRMKKLASKMLDDFPTVRRWEDTDDVFQLATMRLWESLEKIRPENSRHYFNLAAMQVRRQLIDMARSFSGPLGLANNLESQSEGVDSVTQDSPDAVAPDSMDATNLVAWSQFHENVESLSDPDREVFCLIWYQGFSQETAASLLDVSQKTISRRWQRASRTLSGLLEGRSPG